MIGFSEFTMQTSLDFLIIICISNYYFSVLNNMKNSINIIVSISYYDIYNDYNYKYYYLTQ